MYFWAMLIKRRKKLAGNLLLRLRYLIIKKLDGNIYNKYKYIHKYSKYLYLYIIIYNNI